MKRLLLAFLASTLLFSASSCVFVIGAGVGAGALYALGEDSVDGYLKADIEDLFDAAEADFEQHGSLDSSEQGARECTLVGTLNKSKVEVFLIQLTDETTHVVIKARKWSSTSPDLETARDMLDRITFRVE